MHPQCNEPHIEGTEGSSHACILTDLSVHMHVSLFVCLFVYLPACESVCSVSTSLMPSILVFWLSVCVFELSLDQFPEYRQTTQVCKSVCLDVWMSLGLDVCLYVCLYMSVCMSVCESI